MATDFELKDTPSLTLEPDLESVADLVAAEEKQPPVSAPIKKEEPKEMWC